MVFLYRYVFNGITSLASLYGIFTTRKRAKKFVPWNKLYQDSHLNGICLPHFHHSLERDVVCNGIWNGSWNKDLTRVEGDKTWKLSFNRSIGRIVDVDIDSYITGKWFWNNDNDVSVTVLDPEIFERNLKRFPLSVRGNDIAQVGEIISSFTNPVGRLVGTGIILSFWLQFFLLHKL